MTKTELREMPDQELLDKYAQAARNLGVKKTAKLTAKKSRNEVRVPKNHFRMYRIELLRRLEAGADCKRRLEQLEQLKHTDQPHN